MEPAAPQCRASPRSLPPGRRARPGAAARAAEFSRARGRAGSDSTEVLALNPAVQSAFFALLETLAEHHSQVLGGRAPERRSVKKITLIKMISNH